MKRFCTLLFAVMFALTSLLADSPRKIQDFNFNWKFNLGDTPEAKKPSFDDQDWRNLNLPHDWSIEQSYTTENTAGSTGFLPTGIGWYRKSFTIDEDQKDKIIHIEFDGVYCNSEVWINGHYLGIRPYGYSVFSYKLTPHLNIGGENIIAVKVDHANFADSRWYTGSGIYRNVRLVSTSKTYVPQFGAWVETPQVSSKQATIKVRAVVKNLSPKAKKLNLKVLLKDKADKLITSTSQKINVAEVDTAVLNLSIVNPKLWSIEFPNQYKAEVQVFAGKELKDTYEIDFGIRSIKWDANKGFFK